MSALKIKDAQGNWIEVPMIKGDKGDKGDTYELTEQDKQDIADLVEIPESFEIHICSSNEYDSTTRVPTIQNPDEKTFYLVPSEDGISPDLFVEWAYVNNTWEMFGSASIDLSGYLTDVQVNGTSIVDDGIANVPIAGSNLGVVKINSAYGIRTLSSGTLAIQVATNEQVKNPTGSNTDYRSLVAPQTNRIAFYGLAKAAGHDEKDSTLSVGQYTPEAKGAIQSMLGIDSLIAPTETNPFSEPHVIGDLFIINGAMYRAKTAIAVNDVLDDGVNVDAVNIDDVAVKDVQVNGTSVVNNGVASIPIGNNNIYGVMRSNTNYGTTTYHTDSGDFLGITFATPNEIKNPNTYPHAIVPYYQDQATFYGLAKASGDTTQSASSNAIGTYTDEAKASIQTMLGVPSSDDVISDVQINGTSVVTDGVASIPMADDINLGVVTVNGSYGIGRFSTNGALYINYPTSEYIKSGTSNYHPIVPSKQHEATFYGLAKASGDTTQASSSNPVGNYTDEAKTSIKQMLGVVDSYDSLVVNVTGTDPVITGSPSYRYNCGEVTTLTITPPSSGTIDFIFTSGTTPTVLDLPNTVKMPSWWIGVEANTTYEMCITDGVYCGVMSWDA